MEHRGDSWTNALTAMGDTTRDKRLATSFGYAPRLSQGELEELWRGDAMAARIVSLQADEEFREGFDLAFEDEIDGGEVLEGLEDLDALERLHEARTWGRLYGGAVAVLGVDDGRRPSDPLDIERARALRFVNVLTRHELFPIAYYEDPYRDRKFGQPSRYRVNTATPGQPVGMEIHETRLIRFGGVPLPRRVRAEQQGWDDPVLQRVYDSLRGYTHGHVSVEQILQDFTQACYMLQGLKTLVAEGNEAAIKARLRAIEAGRSVLNALILDASDSFQRQTTSVAGIEKLVEAVERRLVAATGYPHTILLGDRPGASLGESGQSQKRDFYDVVRASQRKVVQPALVRLLTVYLATKAGPTGGKVPEKWPIIWRPLWQPDSKTEAEAHEIQARADVAMIAARVLSPREVRRSRFGGQGWSAQTALIEGEEPELEAPEDEEDDVEGEERGDSAPKKKLTARYPSW